MGRATAPDIAATTAMVERHCAEMAAGTHCYRAVLANGDGIGVVDLSDIDWATGTAEVGYILAPQWWRQGLAAEAMTTMIDDATARGLTRLTARSHIGNTASLRLLARLGFVANGTATIMRAGKPRACLICERIA